MHVLHYANELLVRVRLSFQILLHAQHAETVRKKFVDNSDLKVHVLHYANELLVRVRLSFQILLHAQHAETVRKKCLGKE